MSAFSSLVVLASGVVTVGPFLVRAHRFSRLRHSLAGSPRHKAESTFSRTDRQTRLPLLSTTPHDAAVTVGFQPVERLVESVLTSSSGALSGARAVAASATDRLHGRKCPFHRTRAGSATPDVHTDQAKGRWPKRPPLQRRCMEREQRHVECGGVSHRFRSRASSGERGMKSGG